MKYPPWILCPKGNRLSSSVRVVLSEDLGEFERYFLSMGIGERKNYVERFEESPWWPGYYNYLINRDEHNISLKDEFFRTKEILSDLVKCKYSEAVKALSEGNYIKARSLFIELIESGASSAVVGDKPTKYLDMLDRY